MVIFASLALGKTVPNGQQFAFGLTSCILSRHFVRNGLIRVVFDRFSVCGIRGSGYFLVCEQFG
jgi:hypothetical protein